jgi:tRNA-dihydrouridine synthase 1
MWSFSLLLRRAILMNFSAMAWTKGSDWLLHAQEDRPLFVQFGANDPEMLLKAAVIVQEHCDYVDINLGCLCPFQLCMLLGHVCFDFGIIKLCILCVENIAPRDECELIFKKVVCVLLLWSRCPQRVAKRVNYGAFLMEDLPLIQSMVTHLATNLTTPVSCKIRIFPDMGETLAYARMLEDAGCSLLAVHGRTREQKDGRATRADWEAIKAVKDAVRIPVLANGNIRWLEDVHECMKVTGVEGVMSAESLLENPALFAGHRMKPVEDVAGSLEELSREGALNEPALALEYLHLCEKYPVTKKMLRAHVYKLLVGWFKRYPELRDEMNGEQGASIDWIKGMVYRLLERHVASMAGGSPRESANAEISGLAQQHESLVQVM